MKQLVILLGFIITAGQLACAGPNPKEGDKKADEIHWMTLAQAEQKMKEQPRKVLVDVYTGWCGWCKVMDKKTYTNPRLIQYVNENFYAVKFDAEQKSTFTFMGKEWKYQPENRVNAFAIDLLHGKLSYPTTVIMEENFKSAQPIPGYLEVPVMEGILKYFGENNYLHTTWNVFQASFKPEWGK